MTRTNAIVRSIGKRNQRLASMVQRDAFALGSPRGFAWKQPGSDKLMLADPTGALVTTDDAVMSATFIISTSSQDRDGDIVIPKGCVLDNYKRNPIVFYNHQQWEVPIGKAMGPDGRLSVSIQPDRILATCYFDQADPDSVYIYGKVKRGFLNATSIGFFPLEAERLPEKKGRRNGDAVGEQWQGWLFKRWELLEFSIVGGPSNPEALMLDDLDSARISQKLRKALQPFAPSFHETGKMVSGITFTKAATGLGTKTINEIRAFEGVTTLEFNQDGIVPAKGATGLGTAVASEGGALVQPEQKERGTDIQCVRLPKSIFSHQQAASKWIIAHDFKVDSVEEDDQWWTYGVFPESECQPDTARDEPLADGVVARVCQRKIEPEGGPVSDVKAYDDSDSEDTGDDAATEQQMPLGAQCLMELAQHIQGKLPMLEPGIAVRKLYERILPMLAAAAAKDYPDLDLGIEMGEDEEEEPKKEEKGIYGVEVPAMDLTDSKLQVDWSPVMKEMATLQRELRIATGRVD